jgi:hypothetical protein
LVVRPLVKPRKIGTVPGGSMMTNRVTKTSQKNFTQKNLAGRRGFRVDHLRVFAWWSRGLEP